jgi:hypothetical protein
MLTGAAPVKPVDVLLGGTVERIVRISEQTEQRLIWAPTIGNAAAMIALAQIIGNVQSPDTALDALTGPLSIYGTGLLLGLGTIQLYSNAMLRLTALPRDIDELQAETLELKRLSADLAASSSPDQEVFSDVHERAANANDELARQRKVADFVNLVGNLVPWLNGASVAAVALGTLLLLIGHQQGSIVLERASPPANVVAKAGTKLPTVSQLPLQQDAAKPSKP